MLWGELADPVTPVLGELYSLQTHCMDKSQRRKCADSTQTSNINTSLLKMRPWCSKTTTKHKFDINGPNTRDLKFAVTWFCKTTIVRLKGVQSQLLKVVTINCRHKYRTTTNSRFHQFQ